ncbi:aminopeptidase P family protein [Vibrio algarum]|uniref:Aminopeptidase P family protein n=1 Tax=Vibrio algarum TaxID=3020714 RepID=A0ABT4YMJ1_9VIBR|nr:aminopeptidase P family protein [Vibrio sp. KJ40-1]MDB1122625.1 aminopeptidase P family protein [Vibrio sp. KJ40-1]
MDTVISQRVKSIRNWLTANNYDALIIPHEDEFLGEYVPEHNERLMWATGFTGSAGVAVISKTSAAVFVDGRYTVQVRNQVPDDIFSYHHLTEEPFWQWLNSQKNSIKKVAYDPRMHAASWLKNVKHELVESIELAELTVNPIDECWLDRPVPKLSQMRLLDETITGESSSQKRRTVAGLLQGKGADAAILTRLDTICWLLNVRGLDVSRLPVLLSHAIIYSDSSVDFFIEEDRVSTNFSSHVGRGVNIVNPTLLTTRLQELRGKTVLFDSTSTNAWFKLRLESASAIVIEEPDPCLLLKAVKNNSEIEGMKSSHVVDGVAMVKFLHWLDTEVEQNRLHNEATISDKLQYFRETHPSLVDLSFDTISASGPNAAMCHYNHNDQDIPGNLSLNTLYLVDSGGQYPNGTTDITRTIAIGTPTDEMKKLFTLVLKGHIGIATATFPSGTTGSQIDVLARQHLWANGYDFDHGTGHGVGHFLSVHEGPQSISKKPNLVALRPGMVVSNEPGYYRADSFGIRIENLELIVPKETGGDFAGLGFEPLTLCPIDLRCIIPDMLTKPELRWLNIYHKKVRANLSPLLQEHERNWLVSATSELIHS